MVVLCRSILVLVLLFSLSEEREETMNRLVVITTELTDAIAECQPEFPRRSRSKVRSVKGPANDVWNDIQYAVDQTR